MCGRERSPYRSLSRYEPIADECVVRNEERCGERSLQQSDDSFTASGSAPNTARPVEVDDSARRHNADYGRPGSGSMALSNCFNGSLFAGGIQSSMGIKKWFTCYRSSSIINLGAKDPVLESPSSLLIFLTDFTKPYGWSDSRLCFSG